MQAVGLDVLDVKMTVAKQQEEIARLRLLANVTDQVNELVDNLDDHGDQIEDLNEDAENLEQLVTTRLDAQMTRIDTVQSYSQEVNNELQELRALVSNQADEIAQMKMTNEAQEQKIQNLMVMLSQQVQQIQTLTQDTNRQLNEMAAVQANQDTRITSIVQNYTDEDRAIKERIDTIVMSINEIKDEVNNRVTSMEAQFQQAIADQLTREQMIAADISVVTANFTQNAEYVQNTYAELTQSLYQLVNRIEMQERNLMSLMNNTGMDLEDNNDNAIDNMPPIGTNFGDLEALRMRVATQEMRVDSLNSSIRTELSQIEETFASSLMNLSSLIRTDISNAISSIQLVST